MPGSGGPLKLNKEPSLIRLGTVHASLLEKMVREMMFDFYAGHFDVYHEKVKELEELNYTVPSLWKEDIDPWDHFCLFNRNYVTDEPQEIKFLF